MSGAYYNEFDSCAAAWLRELIKAGHIADGEVDERSILEVKADELKGFTQCHFFAGIGVWSHALRKAGWEDDRPIWTGSAPCQPFSAAGKQKGFEDERHLWPAFSKLIGECRPSTVIGEQVSAAIRLGWIDTVQRDFESQNYACGYAVLGAHSVGAPHIRQRLYWVAERGCEECGGSGYRFGDADLGRCSCRMADAERECWDERCELESDGRKELTEQNGVGGGVDGLANTERYETDEEQQRPAEDERGRSPDSSCGCGLDSGLANTEAARPPYRRTGRLFSVPTGCSGEPERMADNDNKGLEGHGRPVAEYDTKGRQEPSGLCPKGSKSMSTRPTNGYWTNPDWLFCRDGKWRPVESFIGEMADGLADRLGYMRIGDRYSLSPLIQKGENRTLRLKGYGNALCAETAIEFIKAYMECRK